MSTGKASKNIIISEKMENLSEEKQNEIYKEFALDINENSYSYLPLIETEVIVDYYYDPGKTSGPPENCYPPESSFEITNCLIYITYPGEKIININEKFLYEHFPKTTAYIDGLLENLNPDDFDFDEDDGGPEWDDDN